MSRRIALPFMASGLALIAVAATVLPFEADFIGLAERSPWNRLVEIAPITVTALVLSLLAGIICWRAPRHPGALLFLAVALGMLGGTFTLLTVPEILAAPPVRVALNMP